MCVCVCVCVCIFYILWVTVLGLMETHKLLLELIIMPNKQQDNSELWYLPIYILYEAVERLVENHMLITCS